MLDHHGGLLVVSCRQLQVNSYVFFCWFDGVVSLLDAKTKVEFCTVQVHLPPEYAMKHA